jgi:hypothetical protein
MRKETERQPARAARPSDHPTAPPAGASPPVSLLALQFLTWVAAGPRTHDDVMDVWRSTCPRQSVWEDMVIDGLVAFQNGSKRIGLTAAGRTALAAQQPTAMCAGHPITGRRS